MGVVIRAQRSFPSKPERSVAVNKKKRRVHRGGDEPSVKRKETTLGGKSSATLRQPRGVVTGFALLGLVEAGRHTRTILDGFQRVRSAGLGKLEGDVDFVGNGITGHEDGGKALRGILGLPGEGG